MAKVYVGRWDCEQCGHKMIKGPETKCPNCGASRPKKVQFYLPTEQDVVRNEEELKQARGGADWKCSFCETDNKAWDKSCQSCGNNRQISDGDKSLETKEYDTGDVPIHGKKTLRQQQNEAFRAAQNTNREGIVGDVYIHPGLKKLGSVFKKLLIVAAVLIGIFAVLVLIDYLRETEISVTVDRLEWNRSIALEEYREVTEEGWEIPDGGRELSNFRAIHHHDRVSKGFETKTRTVREKVGTESYTCGKRDMGNGYFEDKTCTRAVYESRQETYKEEVFKKVPVYRTKYKYAVFRWGEAPPIQTSDSNKKPEWGDVSQLVDNKNLREAGRTEVYIVKVIDDKGEKHEHTIDRSRWDQLTVGQSIKALRGGLGGYQGLAE